MLVLYVYTIVFSFEGTPLLNRGSTLYSVNAVVQMGHMSTFICVPIFILDIPSVHKRVKHFRFVNGGSICERKEFFYVKTIVLTL